MLTRTRRQAQEGYTLIELVLTIALLGIVGGAIASSLLVMISTKTTTEASLAVSRDRQFVSNYFSDDVAGAQVLSEGSQTVCGATMATLVVFTGSDVEAGTTTSVPTTVAWSYLPAAQELRRTACRNGGPADSRTLARNVASAPAVSASCAASVSVTTTPKPPQVALSVPQLTGAPLRLCALRRPE